LVGESRNEKFQINFKKKDNYNFFKIYKMGNIIPAVTAVEVAIEGVTPTLTLIQRILSKIKCKFSCCMKSSCSVNE